MKERILVVDDEPSILELVRFALERDGFEVVTAADGEVALREFRNRPADLVILDLMLPGKDGFEVFRELRKESQVPVIMLTARGGEADKVLGLEIGADDYMTKPFSPRELVARVKAVLRRMEPREPAENQILRVGEITLDPLRHRVTVGDREVQLAPREFELLRMLMANRGVVLSRETLLEKVWGYDYVGDTRTVDVHVVRLRQKLEPDPSRPTYIETVRGVGYRMRDL
ncbi:MULTISPECIES: response regulator transcription factor [Limnochorda]|uniref:response regulator transcription factor n=1 Tax=Limnochorda TaxID=1676651 RepID=UPI0017FDD15B|nr:response regulator transcription factor [Limnochorda pilosa]MBO2485879.1 DNA-binding response regulator [Bacillota bacterium]MBO2519182.1 DNA-binding response regulator [Bacillota bacterium]NMA71042.1 response regulator transcription factor [Bacillota bacterium]